MTMECEIFSHILYKIVRYGKVLHVVLKHDSEVLNGTLKHNSKRRKKYESKTRSFTSEE